MAYTSIHTIRATVSAAIAYITNGDKTVNGVYVNSYACRADSAGASEDFRAVRDTGTGRTQVLAYHMIQSFAPDEVTPEQAMQIGEELCDRYLKGDYQYVIAVHTDKEHTHCHVIFNNTNLYNGLSFTTEHNQGRRNERAWAELREISDEICKENGLSLIDPKGKGVSHYEDQMQKEGKSWKDKLRNMLREIISYSRSFEDFLKNCTASGIEYMYTPQNKVKLKFKLSGEGQQRFTRADTLGDEFEPENIKKTIERALIKERIHNHFGKYFTSTKTENTPPIPSTPSKPTVTPTPLTESKPEYVYKPPTQEEFKRVFGAEPDKPVIAPKPTESKAPEKKEDVWAGIRGMRDSDKIIADLESGGVMSFSELSGFFFNTPHSDDHTTELADLKKKFTAIDTLIAKMKHRDELEPIYKEYQGKSGWSQSRFKKKNAASIEDYEATVKYIKEHIKKYAVDGKPPTMLDLLEKSNKLKSKWNRLNVEHTAFLTKRETAKKYTRQVRQYINEQQMKREREKYRQKKLTQQRKKDTLE